MRDHMINMRSSLSGFCVLGALLPTACSERPATVVAEAAATTAAKTTPAAAAAPLAPDAVRVTLVEHDEESPSWRWRLEFGADIQQLEVRLTGPDPRGHAGSSGPLPRGARSAFEIYYTEQEVTGEDVLRDLKILGGSPAHEAALKAAPDLADAAMQRFTLTTRAGTGQETNSRSTMGIVPGSRTSTAPGYTNADHLIGGPDGQPSVHEAGEEICLRSVVSVFDDASGPVGFLRAGGRSFLTQAGERVPLEAAMETGRATGWRLVIRADTDG